MALVGKSSGDNCAIGDVPLCLPIVPYKEKCKFCVTVRRCKVCNEKNISKLNVTKVANVNEYFENKSNEYQYSYVW